MGDFSQYFPLVIFLQFLSIAGSAAAPAKILDNSMKNKSDITGSGSRFSFGESAFKDLASSLESKISEVEAEIKSVLNEYQMCEEGVIFEHSCFYTVIDREVRWPWANKMCVAHGGQLASITSQDMLTTIGNFMRNKLTEKYGNFGDSIGFWWGATYQDGKMRFLNGSSVEWTHWAEGNPYSDPDYDSMTLRVHQRNRQHEDGFANVKPITYRYRPLCQRYLL